MKARLLCERLTAPTGISYSTIKHQEQPTGISEVSKPTGETQALTAKLHNRLTIMELNSCLERVSQTLNQLNHSIKWLNQEKT